MCVCVCVCVCVCACVCKGGGVIEIQRRDDNNAASPPSGFCSEQTSFTQPHFHLVHAMMFFLLIFFI